MMISHWLLLTTSELKLWFGVTDYVKQVSMCFLGLYISILQGDVAAEYDIKHFVG